MKLAKIHTCGVFYPLDIKKRGQNSGLNGEISNSELALTCGPPFSHFPKKHQKSAPNGVVSRKTNNE
jgi:hypothetical protein